jgi:hypothetical protein
MLQRMGQGAGIDPRGDDITPSDGIIEKSCCSNSHSAGIRNMIFNANGTSDSTGAAGGPKLDIIQRHFDMRRPDRYWRRRAACGASASGGQAAIPQFAR